MALDTKARVCIAKPVLDTAGAYADGDQVGAALTLTNALDEPTDTATVISLVVIDKEKQKPDLDIFLFSQAPTISSVDNAALDISDTEMEAKFLGMMSVRAAQYSDLANSSVATVGGIGLMVQGRKASGVASSKNLYAVIKARSADTYAAADSLVLLIGFAQD